MDRPKKVRVTYHLAPKQLASLQRLSEDSGLAVAELIRRAIDELLAKEKRSDLLHSG